MIVNNVKLLRFKSKVLKVLKKITEIPEGFTNDDLMEVLKGQTEVGSKYKSHFFAMFAQLFCTIAEVIISEFAEKGREAMVNAVKKYGEERGRRIAEIVKSQDKELNLKNFFIYGDLDAKNTLKYTPKIVDGNIEIVGRDCVFCNGCREWDKVEYGQIYCEYIDISILKGYNPNLRIEVPSTLTKENRRCILRYIVKE
ncbi:MAG: L-2-amino-thiazoline-4-carboxylic acid hydrolase [Promethearchaeota archaeon]